ncbi:MAG: hypothetical protein ETSY2_02840 [Candidatus Entotheonella gemina]|uniref:Uncharacterized protein n=1 Tax=Candidatus Entotheonella gemina TaxID=1429439 RepID=W4MGQ4_9BACT|nr:MAG: hypothetical protein ETSY2_02840 [Candidatus Entotheonella gemina]
MISSSQQADIIGWGKGQAEEAVKQTESVLESLTREKVKCMIKQGLEKSWVEKNFQIYQDTFAKNGPKLNNKQLIPRMKLLEKVLSLWPVE